AAATAEAGAAEPPDARLGGADVFNIVYSSGTTGQPKGIVHTHYVRAMYCTLFAQAWRMTPESVVLHTGSIVFNGAFVTLLPALFCGATYVLDQAFDAGRLIGTVRAERVTHVMLVPSQVIALLDHPDASADALASLQVVLSLGAPLHLEHKQRLEQLLPGRFHELYGLTEGFVTILDRTDYPRKPGSVGVPPPFFELQIVGADGAELPPGEVGEICGRGPILMPGYHGRPDLTAEAIRDGWLHTGDLGRVDEDGFLYLVDRQKDLVISGGVNVYPRDIEEVAVQHPAVREAAVFGVPDPKWGESPVCALLLRDGAAVTAAELRDWINARVGARFQRVSAVRLLADFPRNVAGKTLKRELRERWQPEEP
ncbi:MAG TPA: AMP-binding protein, partial [Gammaproteobacteria bacterium]